MSRRSRSRSGGRDGRSIASSQLPRLEHFLRDPYAPVHFVQPAGDFLSDLSALEDRRRWYPGETLTPFGWDAPRTEIGSVARLEYPKAPTPLPGRQTRLLSPSVAFQAHPRANICTRRSVRRQVMHALGKAGRRGIGRGRQHRNQFSGVSCR